MRRCLYIRTKTGALLAVLVASLVWVGVALADWPTTRFDPQQSGFVPDASSLGVVGTLWSLDTGQRLAADQVWQTVVRGQEALVLVAQGRLVARDTTGRFLWATPSLPVTTILGEWDLDGDGVTELLASHHGPHGALFVVSLTDGVVRWAERELPLAYHDISHRNIVVSELDGVPGLELLLSPQLGDEVLCYHFAAGYETGGLLWAAGIEGYSNLIPPVVGDFTPDPGLEVAVLQYRDYTVLDAATGALRLRSAPRFDGHGFGLVATLDADDEGQNAVAHVGVGHVSGYRVGVLDLASERWRWLYEYDPGDAVVRVVPVQESLVDLDGDGHQELVVSFFNNTDRERDGVDLIDRDGINLPERWVTVVFDESGRVATELPDRLIEGIVDLTSDGRPDLVLRVAPPGVASQGFVGDLEIVTWRDGGPLALPGPPQASLVRVLTPRDPGIASFGGSTLPLSFSGGVVANASMDEAGHPAEWVYFDMQDDALRVRARLSSDDYDALLGVPSNGATSAAPLVLDTDRGVAICDDQLRPRSAFLPADGAMHTPLGLVATEGDPLLAMVGGDGRVRTYTASGLDTPYRGGSLEAAVRYLGGAYVAGSTGRWVTIEEDVDGHLVLSAWDATSTALSWRVSSSERVHPPAGFLAAGETILVPTTTDTGESSHAVLTQVDLATGDSVDRNFSLPAPVRNAGVLVDSQTWVGSSSNALVWLDLGADSPDRLVVNQGANSRLIAADLDGGSATGGAQSPREVVSSQVWLGDGLWGWCAYGAEADDPRWCAPERYFGESGVNGLARLPTEAGDDLIITSAIGEVRRLDGRTGAAVFSRCLAAGAVTPLDADPETEVQAPCPAFGLSPAVVHDLNGDGAFEIIVGASDGFIYALSAAGDLKWREPLPGPAGQPVLIDLDSDSSRELLVPTGAGRLVALGTATLDAPDEVREVAILSGGRLGEVDIDESADTNRIAIRWYGTEGASSYRVELQDRSGATIQTESIAAAQSDSDGGLSHIFGGLQLATGATFFAVVSAHGDGTVSPTRRSDGVTILSSEGPLDFADAGQGDTGSDVGQGDPGSDVGQGDTGSDGGWVDFDDAGIVDGSPSDVTSRGWEAEVPRGQVPRRFGTDSDGDGDGCFCVTVPKPTALSPNPALSLILVLGSLIWRRRAR